MRKRTRPPWCPACNKLSGHPQERCRHRRLVFQYVELPQQVQNELGARLELAEEAAREARIRKHQK